MKPYYKEPDRVVNFARENLDETITSRFVYKHQLKFSTPYHVFNQTNFKGTFLFQPRGFYRKSINSVTRELYYAKDFDTKDLDEFFKGCFFYEKKPELKLGEVYYYLYWEENEPNVLTFKIKSVDYAGTEIDLARLSLGNFFESIFVAQLNSDKIYNRARRLTYSQPKKVILREWQNNM